VVEVFKSLMIKKKEAERIHFSRIECGGIEADEEHLLEPGRSSGIQEQNQNP
jgi:hypothetical protein